ncbi:hypothetical protein RHMOL_Rhmol06G0027500 [Rhododendron molle]|uniref:Uncharacterized protein n=3 Tax=Rhododendron molle TaxID=49168 RepID=A0ACC0NA17_RHOML|nr:hypothetical protein RHMOL_Rhmol06G0027500 [Rhododendron molle]KAI8549477.1 hypothetical protein RHMOL_Rhmol06G0027500 [Rhododendron molle]KAI8549478.1 hypothetical protein RHMOL_Rhmol06G0027500 [Rhododendron molle]
MWRDSYSVASDDVHLQNIGGSNAERNGSLQIPASVWLPSLKILKMEDVIYENGVSAQKLIHGCPVLEYLDFYRDDAKSGEVLNISVPTLKRVEVTCLGPGQQLVFNTPTLEYLDLTYYWAEGFSLVNLSSLLEARIDINLSGSRPINSANILKLLRGIANFHADITDYVPTTFHTLQNLTHLRLPCGFNCRGFNLNFLNGFLGCSPNLEVLVLEGNRFSSTKSWSSPLRVPHCLLFNLKEVEFLYLRRENQEFEVIEYLLRSAEVLKKMTVDCQHSHIWQIAQVPRASKTCILNLI